MTTQWGGHFTFPVRIWCSDGNTVRRSLYIPCQNMIEWWQHSEEVTLHSLSEYDWVMATQWGGHFTFPVRIWLSDDHTVRRSLYIPCQNMIEWWPHSEAVTLHSLSEYDWVMTTQWGGHFYIPCQNMIEWWPHSEEVTLHSLSEYDWVMATQWGGHFTFPVRIWCSDENTVRRSLYIPCQNMI